MQNLCISTLNLCTRHNMCKTFTFLAVKNSNIMISVLIIVQRDATKSSLFIILQVHSTCFGCQLHPSSGVHKTVTTASGTGHIFCAVTSLQRGQARLTTLEGGSWLVPEAVVTVLCLGHVGGRQLHKKNMTSTGCCSYSFVYSWWWVWLTPETWRVNLQNNK